MWPSLLPVGNYGKKTGLSMLAAWWEMDGLMDHTYSAAEDDGSFVFP